MNNKAFPLFQYSVFLDSSRDEQIVIRTDTWQEFLDAKVEVNKILEKRQKDNAFSQPSTTPPNAPQQTQQEDLGNCSSCGAPNVTYRKSGKVGCSKYCWRK